jgi:hypothetical protein
VFQAFACECGFRGILPLVHVQQTA